MTPHATRFVEFWLFVFMIMWGIGVGGNPASMSDPIYRIMIDWTPPHAWSATAGAVGIVHLASWRHNGEGMWWTGPMRAWGCLATTVILSLMASGAYMSIGVGPASVGYAAAAMAASHCAVVNIFRFMSWRGLLTRVAR